MSDFLKRLGVILFFILSIAIAWEGLAPVIESSRLGGQVGSLEAYCYVYGSGCTELETQDQLSNCCTPLFSTDNECSATAPDFLSDSQIAASCCAQSCNGVQKCMDECTCELTGDCADTPAFSVTFDLQSIPVAISGEADDFLTLNLSEEVPVQFENFEVELAKALQGQTGSVVLKGRESIPFTFAGLGEVHSYLTGTGASSFSIKGEASAPFTISTNEGNVALISTVVLPVMIDGEQDSLPAEATLILSVGGIDGTLLPSQFPFPVDGSGSVTVTVANDSPTSLAIAVSGVADLEIYAPGVQLGEPESIIDQQSSTEPVAVETSSDAVVPEVISSAPSAEPEPVVEPEPVAVRSVQSSVQQSSIPDMDPEFQPELPLARLVPIQPSQQEQPQQQVPTTRPPIARTPLQQTGPAAVLMIAIGSAAGVGFVRRKKK